MGGREKLAARLPPPFYGGYHDAATRDVSWGSRHRNRFGKPCSAGPDQKRLNTAQFINEANAFSGPVPIIANAQQIGGMNGYEHWPNWPHVQNLTPVAGEAH